MKIIFNFTQKVLGILLFMLLCQAAGSLGVEEELTCPVKIDLAHNNADVAEKGIVAGDASIRNIRDERGRSTAP